MSESKQKKGVAERLETVRGHRVRRQILQAAIEADVAGKTVSPTGLAKQLGLSMQTTAYHTKILRDEGALRLKEEIPRRGAVEHRYVPTREFLATMVDSVALDQIAEALDERNGSARAPIERSLIEIVRSTGRPVEA